MTKTPTKRTSSPRKKSAWATAAKSPMKSPRKAAASRSLAEMLESYEGLNKSWAEEMEDEMQRRTLGEASASPREQRGGTRRKGVSPKRADPKPRFVKSLEAQEITEAISAGQFRNLRSSTRAATAAIKAAAKPKSKPIVDSVEIVQSVEVIETTTSYISPTATRTRKRHISTSSTATDLEPASPSRRGLLTPQRSSGRPARKNAKMDGASPARNRINTSLVHQSPSADFRAKDYWEEPKLGWCQDAATIERREKELNRAKEKPVYPAYLEKVPKDQRIKGIHPVTPNKYLNYPRRSWDTLMRNWKRQLYEFADITPSPSVATSANTSFCSSEGQDGEELVDTKHILRDISVNVPSGRTEEDSVAFHLGNFDLDTRTLGAGGDESTIKGAGGKCVGPTDFAHAVAHGAKK